eukprot:5627800-Amphidinium_carterae.1
MHFPSGASGRDGRCLHTCRRARRACNARDLTEAHKKETDPKNNPTTHPSQREGGQQLTQRQG